MHPRWPAPQVEEPNHEMKFFRFVFRAVVTLMPWPLRRRFLNRLCGYEIDPGARIGLSWIWPSRLRMSKGARIGHLNVAIHLDLIDMGEHSEVVRGNWITGFPKGAARHFAHQPERKPELRLGRHAAVTKNHHLDCTSAIEIGEFATVAGYGSQFLTHSIDIIRGCQHSEPIRIGAFSFVGTDCTVLGGAVLPDHSVLGAKSLLREAHEEEYRLYAGVPAGKVKEIPKEAAYFARAEGHVW